MWRLTVVQRRLRRETVLTLDLSKKRGWHYSATIERNRKVSIYASGPDDTDPELVLETAVQAIWGSYYEVYGKKLVRRYDPRRQTRQAGQSAVLEQRTQAGESAGFRNAVKQIEALLGNKAARLEEGQNDFNGLVLYTIAVGREQCLDVAELQDRFLSSGACSFYLEVPEKSSRKRNIGILATHDPRDVAYLLQNIENAGVGVDDVLKVVGPLLKSRKAWLEAANTDFLLLRFRKTPRNHKSICRQVISKLEQEETTLDDVPKMDRDLVAKRELFLWWD
jgi:hypothetical protein